MQAALATQPNTPYRDRKRHAWLLSLLVPSTVLVGPAAMVWSGDAWALWAPVLFFYGVVPAIDYFMGQDLSNPPQEAVPELAAERYYPWITHCLAPALCWGSGLCPSGPRPPGSLGAGRRRPSLGVRRA